MGARPDELYGIPIKRLAQLCGVSERTAQRWKDGTTCPPPSALMILRGDLGCMAPEWAGWRVNGADLVSPDGWTVDRNAALAVPLLHAQIEALKSEIERLRAELKDLSKLEDQPQPPQWLVGYK